MKQTEPFGGQALVHTNNETLSEVRTRHLATQCNVKADTLLDALADM